MELSVADGDEEQFDCYVEQLSMASLDPRLNTYSLYFQGLGLRRFGRDGADEMLSCARDFASNHQLHQLAFEIERTLDSPTVPMIGAPDESITQQDSDELRRIAEVIMQLREDAVTQSS